MAGRGRAFLFNKNKQPPVDSASVTNQEPSKPRGRAAFLQLLRAGNSAEQDSQSTISDGSDESEVVLNSGDASPSKSSSRPRGRAALFSSKSSTSGQDNADSLRSVDVQNLKIVDDSSSGCSSHRESPEKEKSPPVTKHGMTGRKTEVAVNYVKLDLLNSDRGIWEYEVIFDSEVDSRILKSKLVNMHFMSLNGTVKVYDMGSRLYSPLKTESEVTSGVYESRNGNNVKVSFRRKCEQKLTDCVWILNIIMKRIKGELQLVSFGRSDYNPAARKTYPHHKLEVWPGYVTAIEEYEGGIFLNCDVSHRVLQTSTVYDSLMDCIRATRGKGMTVYQDVVRKMLVGQSVITNYNNKHIRIDDVDFDKSPLSTFEKNGQQVTYVKYYEDQYKQIIKDKNQPMLINRVKKKPMGKETVDILNYYVPELCSPTGLTEEQRLDSKLKRELSGFTQLTPAQRDQALILFLRGIQENKVCKKMLEDWGLKFSVRPMELTARILDPETIYFDKYKRSVTESNADWGRALKNNRLLEPVHLMDWAIVCTIRDKQLAENFYEKCPGLGGKIGVSVNKPRYIVVEDDHPRTYCARLKEAGQLQIVVIIFPTQRDDRYSAVKKLCTVDLGVQSQVINSRTLRKDAGALSSVVLKVMLQLNCKVGGSLWGVRIPYSEDGVMFCGMDAYHEAGQRSSSIIACVCSIDEGATRWTSKTCQHARGQEISDKLLTLFRECLLQYYSFNGFYPKRIIMFRDGVGDGQLKVVQDFEIPQLRKLFGLVNQNYSPMLTYMVIQKRINTRFYEKRGSSMNNPLPGTVLDHTVTRRKWYDFFLVNQNVRQGTVAPTHYIVVEDSSDMTTDMAQKVAFNMTHMYYNWNGTVRVPAPCQYAHKLAYIVGQHIHHHSVHENLKNTLWFL